MKYMKLDDVERDELMKSLNSMKDFLVASFGKLSPEEACLPGRDNSFSPVEQVWHLADLEREGFGVRINRLRTEDAPHLADFDGNRIAKERNYRSLSLAEGILAFEEARNANLKIIQVLSVDEWERTGTQDGVGEVSLCDIPVFIRQHDQSHIQEILEWSGFVGRGNDA